MSKQSEAKEKQGFVKDSPKCSNCKHFTSDKEEVKKQWSRDSWVFEKNLRCSIGGFKVGKSNYCNQHESITNNLKTKL